MNKYGKIRTGDIPLLKSVITFFRRNNLYCGLHGTSLWNTRYKDLDLLVFSIDNNVNSFKNSLKKLLEQHQGRIINEKGNDTIGLDYEIKIGKTILHLSFVILL